MKKQLLLLAFLTSTTSAFADITSQLARFVGYTIIASKTVAGYQDGNGKKSDSFEGCEYDRVIIFDDNKILTCAGYGYQYSYRPTAIIISNGSSFKMIIESDVYDMRR
ncbi:hypothetical protein [Acidovorax sp. JHL-3]|uniref:hypothetical protein n=1 Tax=Acidovorax sp. JHL-3 TaxID=1276755 RepID=UPI0012DEB971|nr:hypothetical protein [Acidovorax sp. JHL-3]